MPEERPDIRPNMTVLDVISRYRRTEAVFRKYDDKAGVCLCCDALFEPLWEVAVRAMSLLKKRGEFFSDFSTDFG
ncbi:MAG: hypothetical protein JRF65_08470 [Deltaproteobacteria bacterium]|nr:hypothetical protein [Deltaproteobacteria bacterium]